MHRRCFSVVATIATSVTLACGDARLDDVTAPRRTAMPAPPVANQWPSEEDLLEAEIPGAIGIQAKLTPWFSADNLYFIVDARITFQWANLVSATVRASLINATGTQINSGQASLSWYRIALPVPSGDTTFTVRIATNNTTCGLTGKSSANGLAAQRALSSDLVTIDLYKHEFESFGQDVLQPKCTPEPCEVSFNRTPRSTTGVLRSESDCEDDAPAAPSGGEPVEVCYEVWREFWYYDFWKRRLIFLGEVYLGTFCYIENET